MKAISRMTLFATLLAAGACAPTVRNFGEGGGGSGGDTSSSGSSSSGGGESSTSSSSSSSSTGGTGGSGGVGGMGGTGGMGGVCMPGETQCMGNAVQQCGMNGQWQPATACPSSAPICSAGVCVPPSCEGLPPICGPAGNENCCDSPLITGGSFNRLNSALYPAKVSDFRLDRFEVTVGRFRKFVEGYPGNMPAAGAGAHPLIPGSGWNTAWSTSLPSGKNALSNAVKCSANATWTDAPGANESLPMGCLDWYTLFAFCAWDGGRLPTEAEWDYAAAGGNQQRKYPWGDAAPDPSYASYGCLANGGSTCVFADILKAGALSPKGDGRWGQADLAGGMIEWLLDKWTSPYATVPCNDCAEIVTGASRVIRGGGWNQTASYLPNTNRNYAGQAFVYDYIAGRCARSK